MCRICDDREARVSEELTNTLEKDDVSKVGVGCRRVDSDPTSRESDIL